MIRFLPSQQTKGEVEDIVDEIKEKIAGFGPSNYDMLILDNADDLPRCVKQIRSLTAEVTRWKARGDDFSVYVDITGGTKAMAGALSLVAHRWPCRFVYVGGERREADGVGDVVSGHERVLSWMNPWEALGYQVQEDAVLLFNGGNYSAAHQLLMDWTRRGDLDGGQKAEIAVLANLVEGYALWDRFQHKQAADRFRKTQPRVNDLRHLFGWQEGERLAETVAAHVEWLGELNADTPSKEIVCDLLANARRRAFEGKHDDAVARLYRALEAWAQFALKVGHDIATNAVEPEQVPAALRDKWWNQASEEPKKIGLREAYQLLFQLDDPLGRRFNELVSSDERVEGALAGRNTSILAHGFQAVPPEDFETLWKAALNLTEIDQSKLPQFPVLELAH